MYFTELEKAKFLLGENVDVRVKAVFRKYGPQIVAIGDLGWKGVKNGDLSRNVPAMVNTFAPQYETGSLETYHGSKISSTDNVSPSSAGMLG